MEKITTVLFDLDGTLLPMDQDLFVKSYFKRLAEKMAPRGYDPEGLIKAVWGGTAAMVQNDGRATNEEVFWDFFSSVYGEKALKDIPVFQEFYEVEFQEARQVCGHNPLAARSVALCRELGLRRVLATNPLFPSIATESRMRWAASRRRTSNTTPPMRIPSTASPTRTTTGTSSPTVACVPRSA